MADMIVSVCMVVFGRIFHAVAEKFVKKYVMLPTLRRMAGSRYISKGERKVKNIVKFSKVWMLTLLCALFLGVGIKAEAAPGTVQKIEQTGHAINAVEITWPNVNVGNPAGYKVEWSESTTFTNPTSELTTSSSYIIKNLTPGKHYYVRVSAYDSAKTFGPASAACEVVTAPLGKVENLKQKNLASKKISFSWKKVAGADAYMIAYKKENSSDSKSKTVTSTSSSISASTDSAYAIGVLPMTVSKTTDYEAYVTDNSAAMYMYTTPKKVTNLKLYDTGSTSSPTAAIAAFTGKMSNAADGYEYEIYGYNNKRLAKKTVAYKNIIAKTTSGKLVFDIKNNKIKNNQFMKIRIRPYVLMNGKKKAGSWSDYLWFAKYPTKLKAEFVTPGTAANGVLISWSKVAGAKDYTVYVTRGSRYGKYTKLGNTSATKYSFNSVGGSPLSNGTYYYYVVANKKVGKKTYKSDTSWKGLNGFSITTQYTYY